MVLAVTTSGPGSAGSSIFSSDRQTYDDMINLISDEIDDTTNEYSQQIRTSIMAAIRFCQREPLYFNESREQSFNTVVGQQWYTTRDVKVLAAVGRILAAYCQDTRGRSIPLVRKTPKEQEALSQDKTTGAPRYFCYFAQQLSLYPIPDKSVYVIRLLLAPAKIDDNIIKDQHNPWFSEAFALIKARAKYLLYKDIIKDPASALVAFNDFNEQLQSLQAETSRRAADGFIQPTSF